MICLYILALVLVFGLQPIPVITKDFIAAVYEQPLHPNPSRNTVVTKEAAVLYMMSNIDTFESIIQQAKEMNENTSVIVFPENGILGYGLLKREILAPYLEHIPDIPGINLCKAGFANVTTPIQYRLSCLAQTYSVYLIANIGESKNCTLLPGCPTDGHYQYLTSVAYDCNGNFVAKYRKKNNVRNLLLCTDEPKEIDFAVFQTPFGKFGLSSSHDLIYREPGIKLVEEFQIEHLVLPTIWDDRMPLWSAIGFHSSWARSMNVNILAAGAHVPTWEMTGSGLYSPKGVVSYYRRKDHYEGKLVLDAICDDPTSYFSKSRKPGSCFSEYRKPNFVNSRKVNQVKNEDTFYSKVDGDMILFTEMVEMQGSLKMCYNESTVCCSLTYSMLYKEAGELFLFGVYNGLHNASPFHNSPHFYMQTCLVLNMKKRFKLNTPKVISEKYRVYTIFQTLSMNGSFDTRYVYPQVIGSGVTLLPREWDFEKGHLFTTQKLSRGLLTASLVARPYQWDEKQAHNPAIVNESRLNVVSATVLCIAFTSTFVF